MPDKPPDPAFPAPAVIAIVDDDASVLTALGSLVRSLGHEVQLFASAEAFLMAEAGAHCLICDVNLPGMSGWDLHSLMQRRGLSVPTIMMSAFTDRTAQGAGPPVFQKPFDAGVFVAALHDLLARRAP